MSVFDKHLTKCRIIRHKNKDLKTPDKGSRNGCVLSGVFYCSGKGQAIRTLFKAVPQDSTGRLPGKPEQNAVPRERGQHGHKTGWEQVYASRRQISYFFCTYRSFLQRGCGAFLSDIFLFIPAADYKRIKHFNFRRTGYFYGALFLRPEKRVPAAARGACAALRS